MGSVESERDTTLSSIAPRGAVYIVRKPFIRVFAYLVPRYIQSRYDIFQEEGQRVAYIRNRTQPQDNLPIRPCSHVALTCPGSPAFGGRVISG